MTRLQFRTESDSVLTWLNGPDFDELAEDEFKKGGKELEAIARSRAIWADRTGNARRGISSDVENREHVVALSLFHTVDYGKWLELIQNGRFAIIGPTMDAEGRRIAYNAIRRIRYARSKP
jgi:hypothetical protein